ncbi:MAG: alanine racemase [Candidatus Cloacimonadota bacterium]|nr:alanine racemase [Candidatus Cloacimonadota bacterium]
MIKIPSLVLDMKRCISNIEKGIEKAKKHNLLFRPHFKTHQSAEIGKWFKDRGVDKITVSSLKMASYFSQSDWNNITLAFPANPLQIRDYNKLSEQCELILTVSTPDFLKYIEKLSSNIRFYVELDNGYKRSGLEYDSAIEVAQKIPEEQLEGFLLHAGDSYNAKSKKDILQLQKNQIELAGRIKKRFPHKIFSTGDTPTFSVAEDFTKIDEIRPGNFVFYDVMQLRLKSCACSQIALAVYCPVVAKYATRNEIVIHGGAVHLSKENLEKQYGLVAVAGNEGWNNPLPDTYVKSVSQEHGIISTRSDILQMIEIGDILAILPIHSCLTANLFKRYITTENKVIKKMKG